MRNCLYEDCNNISQKDSDNDIHLAAERGNIEKIKALVEKGVPVDIKNEENNTPLQHIVKNNLASAQTVETLSKLGASINGWFALGEAALCGNVGRVRQLFNLNPELLEEKLNNQGVLDLTMVVYRLVKKEVVSNYTISASKELDSIVRTVGALVMRGADITEYEYMKDYPEDYPEIVNIIENAAKLRSNYTYFKKHHQRVSEAKIAEINEMQRG
ncbi:MAG: ankyrin repeat domain-containing protein [Alphaproteobacteria bacterium]|nr:ankyrin repeat domain-containing protein [Alphaproteobacteria bacterium]